MLVDVELVLDEFVSHQLFQIGALASRIGQFIDYVLHQMKAIDVILHAHVEGRGDRAFFLVTADMQVAVGAAIVVLSATLNSSE